MLTETDGAQKVKTAASVILRAPIFCIDVASVPQSSKALPYIWTVFGIPAATAIKCTYTLTPIYSK